MTEAPQAYKNAGLAMIAAGALNALWSAIWAVSLIVSLWWICCLPLPVVFFCIGLTEVYSGWLMMHGEKKRWSRATAVVGAFAAVTMCFGIVSVALEIYAAFQLSKGEVRTWLSED